MTLELVAWLVLGFLALVAARHGHLTVCIAINPVGVAVVFEDAPRARYWLLQVILPALVSWAVCYAWLYGLFTYPASYNAGVDVAANLGLLPWIVTLITVLTSGGDVLSGNVDLANPVHGPARVHRGFAVLRKAPALVLFTGHGREHWHAAWTAGKAGASVGPAPA